MIMLSGFRNHRNYNISRLKSKMYAHGFQKMFTSKHFKACFEMLAPPARCRVKIFDFAVDSFASGKTSDCRKTPGELERELRT